MVAVVAVVAVTAAVAFPAVNPAAVPVTLVITPDTGVPNAGATSVLLVRVSVPANVAIVPETPGNVIVIDADWANTVLKAPVVEKFPARASWPVVRVNPDPPPLTTTANPPLPEKEGNRSNAALIAVNSARIRDERPVDPVPGLPDAA